jgi:hypothetical protein
MNSFYGAVHKGNFARVKQYIEHGFKPNLDNVTYILTAVVNGYMNIVRYLINLGYDPASHDSQSLGWAYSEKLYDMHKYLLMSITKRQRLTYISDILKRDPLYDLLVANNMYDDSSQKDYAKQYLPMLHVTIILNKNCAKNKPLKFTLKPKSLAIQFAYFD